MRCLKKMTRTTTDVFKAIAVFVVMFAISFCLSSIELVDYSDYIENQRWQIALLADAGGNDRGKLVAPKLTAIYERGCRREWKSLKEELPDIVGLIAAVCSLLFYAAMVERVVVSKSRPFVSSACRWMKGSKFAEGIVCGGMLAVFVVAYMCATAILRRLSYCLKWPKLAAVAGGDSSIHYMQFLSAWDQLLVCRKWLNIVCYELGVMVALAIVVWCFANIRRAKVDPAC